MKISKLQIEQYRHLENLDFDFTYPNDFHIEEKRGKPLDKICFIGQSATGKTSLLELIDKAIASIHMPEIPIRDMFYAKSIEAEKTTIKANITFATKNDSILFRFDSLKGIEFYIANNNEILPKLRLLNGEASNLYFFKSNLICERNIEVFSKNPIELFEKIETTRCGIYEHRGFTFDDKVGNEIWLSLIFDILEYRKKFTQKMSELVHNSLLYESKEISTEFEKWQKFNPNKIKEFAEKLNPILKKLNLEVELVDTQYLISLKKTKNKEIISIQNTSTGTKGLLLSFLPLFKLDTKDSIILIDEPERSLYPDMQMDLMEHYQNLAPEAQFIVATHSPFIAASFEPEERFILSFDKEGKVVVRRGSSPIGDDPNDMLKNDFGINYYNSFGEAAYKKYLKLKEDLAKEKNPNKKKELLLETVKLGDTYNF